LKKLINHISFIFFVCFITTISFAGSPSNKNIIDTHAYIEGKFSGVEVKPIVEAFYSWMEQTKGGVTIHPPTLEQRAYFYNVLKPNITDDDALNLDQVKSVPVAWGGACSKDFFVMRVLSNDPIVMLIDGGKDSNVGVLAYTFLGCKYKFIAVVADRIEDADMFKLVLMHELGHMWGLLDNTKGNLSVMNGMYPMSKCITKSDIEELYEIYGRKEVAKSLGGCDSK
jgi:hypothetical protein